MQEAKMQDDENAVAYTEKVVDWKSQQKDLKWILAV
jgi:hypothetical protein